MRLIQLQRLDKDLKTNLGGFYLNVDHLSALYVIKINNNKYIPHAILIGGEHIPIAGCLSDILDTINTLGEEK